MRKTTSRLTTLIIAVTSGAMANATTSKPAVRDGETKVAAGWADTLGMLPPAEKAARPSANVPEGIVPPFSFVYGGRNSSGALAAWKREVRSRRLNERMTEQVATFTDPKTGLEVRAEATLYKDFPAVEWVLHIRNTGASDTPVLESILPLDARLPLGKDDVAKPILHYAKGALCSIDDFAPVDTPLERGSPIRLQPGGGRSSSEAMPFFNVDLGGEGLVIAVGWTGEWAAEFIRNAEDRIELRAGMAATHLILHPGEEIRAPRILVLAWQGERIRGNNLLRRFLLAHHRPTPGGEPLVLPLLIGTWGGSPAVEHLKTIEKITRRDLPISLYWIDAEWFGKVPWYANTGNWEVRKDLYPQGFKAISEPLHKSGRKFLLWFEPQRVSRGTPWSSFADRPNWLLELGDGNPVYKQRNLNWGIPHDDPRWVQWESRRSQIAEGDLLWNMGEPAARRFLTDWISARIDEFGLDWYREDFNIAPSEFWQHADPPNRRGMTEIRYVEGLYAMWDELLQRHPQLAIDNCASGGRRIDLETVGRATALWRTDWPADAIHKQCHTFGLLSWVPLNMSGGAVPKKGNEYEVRSAMTAGLNVELPPQDDDEFARQARMILDQYLDIQKYYYGDYYPLTQYSQAKDVWMAYQLDLPETGEGLVVVLRRPASPQSRGTFRLHALTRDASYEVTNLDTLAKQTIPGGQLTDNGLEVELTGSPDSTLICYRRGPRLPTSGP